MDFAKIWEELQDAIKNAVEAEVSYTVHIKPAKAVSFEDSVFTITVPSSINRNMIEFRFKNKIESILEAYTGQKITLNVILEDELENFNKNNGSLDEEEKTTPVQIHKKDLSINEKFTFENFVIGSSNEYAAAAAISTSENPGRIYNPLFLYGNSGLGKTHLMCAIGNKIKKEHPDYKVLYITTENFTAEFVECIKNYKMDEFRKKYRTADVLLVDDVQFLQNREGFQEEFFHTFNDLHSLNKQIVLTRKPSELITLEERLVTRFSQGLTFDISVPDYDTRLAILRKKAELNNYEVGDEILKYIADRIKSNVRELEGALLKVISIGQLSHKEIDIELTKFAIESILPKDGIVKITPDKIMDKVSTFYSVTKEELIGKSRVKSLVLPRQVAMYLCTKLTDMNAGMIGKTFSKDRTTVLHSVEKIETDLNTDKIMKTNIDYIIKDLQSL